MATGVLRLMASFGVLPNIVCVNSAMAAAAKAGHVSYALRLMDALRGTFGTEEDEYGRPIFGVAIVWLQSTIKTKTAFDTTVKPVLIMMVVVVVMLVMLMVTRASFLTCPI